MTLDDQTLLTEILRVLARHNRSWRQLVRLLYQTYAPDDQGVTHRGLDDGRALAAPRISPRA